MQKLEDMRKGDRITILIGVIILLAFLWLGQILMNDFEIIRSVLITIAMLIVAISFITKKESKKLTEWSESTPSGKYVNRMIGWEVIYSSIGSLISAIVFPILGIYLIFTKDKVWWIGIIFIILGPMLWYLGKVWLKKGKERVEYYKKDR